jgi:AIPR protein
MMTETNENTQLTTFYNILRQDVHAAVEMEEEGGISEEKFTDIVISYLSEAGETENARECRDIKEDKIGRKIHKVNGYALSENYETLDLFVTIYNGTDAPSKIYKDDITSAVNQCTRFLKNSVNGYVEEIEESSPVFDLALTIRRNHKDLVRVNIFILTDGISTSESPTNSELGDILINYHVRDIEYLNKLNSSKLKRLPIEIDFDADFGGSIPCITMPTGNDEYESYLAVISGTTLAAIYQNFGARLLEQNVRSFLQFTGKINKGIRETLIKSPHMFLAFNNGIAATAETVELEISEKGTSIKSVKDLQIVNGGQTTASLFHTLKKDKADLSKVFVQMKLSVIKNTDDIASIVSRISQYANTQNKVSDADLSSNHPFHIEMEKLSRNTWSPPKQGQTHQTRWFFERARGQYKDSINREFTPKRKLIFEKSNPKMQMFVKEDLAKFINCWDEMPYFVVKGNQKNYVEFMRKLKIKDKPNNIFFEDLIAKGIVFRQAEKIYGVKPNSIGDMRYVTVPYSIAWLNFATDNRLDLLKIWKNQDISSEMKTLLKEIMIKVENYIRKTADGSLYGEWAKKEDCWSTVSTQKFVDISIINNDFQNISTSQQRYKKTDEDIEAEELKQKIERIKSVPILIWKRITTWGYATKNLTPHQETVIFNLYKKIGSNKQFTENEIKYGLDVLDLVIEKNIELFYSLDETDESESKPQSTDGEITLELIKRLTTWDKEKRRLKDYEFVFLDRIVKGINPLDERNKKIAALNLSKAKKYGFR